MCVCVCVCMCVCKMSWVAWLPHPNLYVKELSSVMMKFEMYGFASQWIWGKMYLPVGGRESLFCEAMLIMLWPALYRLKQNLDVTVLLPGWYFLVCKTDFSVVICQGLAGQSPSRERATGPGVSANPDEGWALPEVVLHPGWGQVSLRGTSHKYLISLPCPGQDCENFCK